METDWGGGVNHEYWSNFCRKGKPSIRLVTCRCSASLVVHCVTSVQGRKRSSATRQCRVLNCSPVRGQDSEARLITSPPSTLQSGTSPSNCNLFGFLKKIQIRGQHNATNEADQTTVHRCLKTAGTDLCLKGIFTPLQHW